MFTPLYDPGGTQHPLLFVFEFQFCIIMVHMPWRIRTKRQLTVDKQWRIYDNYEICRNVYQRDKSEKKRAQFEITVEVDIIMK